MSNFSFVDCADIHLGKYAYGKLNPKTGLDSSLESTLNCLDELVNYAIKNKVTFVRILGDLSKMMNLTEVERSELYKRLYKLSLNGIEVYVLIGNHDEPDSKGSVHNVKSLKALNLKNVHVIETPTIISKGDYHLLFIPYIASVDEWVIEYRKLRKKIWGSAKKIIVGLHGNLEGVSTYHSELIEGDELPDIPKKTFADDPAIMAVGAGHQHTNQVLSTEPLIYYTGSLDRVSQEERNDPKGFVHCQVKNSKLSYNFIEVHARKFIQIKLSSKKLPERDYKSGIIKVVLNNNDFDDFDKQDIEQRLKELGAEFVTFKKKIIESEGLKKFNTAKEGTTFKGRINNWVESNVEQRKQKAVRLRALQILEDLR